MTGLGGFEVDMAALRRVARRVASSSGSEEDFDLRVGEQNCVRDIVNDDKKFNDPYTDSK